MFIFNPTNPLNLTTCTKNLKLATEQNTLQNNSAVNTAQILLYIFLNDQQLEVMYKHMPQHAWHIIGVFCNKHTATSEAGDGMLLNR